MALTTAQAVIIILVASVCTFATRLFPFALFGGKKEVPAFVKYLGDILPVAIIGVIIPQLIAGLATAGVHLWKKNTLLSIAVGTIGYMLLIHFVFI